MTDEELAAIEAFAQALSAPVEEDAVGLPEGHHHECDCPQCKAGGPKHEAGCRCESCAEFQKPSQKAAADMPEEKRQKWADSGEAMPDGSFPIRDAHAAEDIKNALQSIGRAKDRKAVEAHIRKRAKETKHEDLLPDWITSQKANAQEMAGINPAGYTTAEKKPKYRDGWIAVDLDGTLAESAPPPSIGKPVPAMVDRVKAWLADGEDVRIFTARGFEKDADRKRIESWCEKAIGQVLPITNVKHAGVREIWDDKAVRVKKDEGEPMHELAAGGANSEGKGRQTGGDMEDDEVVAAQLAKKKADAEKGPEGEDPEETVETPEEKGMEEEDLGQEACDKGGKKMAHKMAALEDEDPEQLVRAFIASVDDDPQAASAHMEIVWDAMSLELAAMSNDSNLPPQLRGKGLVEGKPVVTFKKGLMTARDGRRFLVDDSALARLLADGNSGQIVPFTYQHEKGPQGDENSGYIHRFTLDADGLKAHVAWTSTAASELAAGKRGPVSPDVYIEALHPDTFAVLDENSPLYAGPGQGRFNTPFLTNTFRPIRWRAVSLVGVAALPDLPIATLSAQQTSSAMQPEGKETIVKHEDLCQSLSLDPATTTPERALAELASVKERAKSADAMRADLAAKQAAEEDAARKKAAAKEQADLIRQELAAQDKLQKFNDRLTTAQVAGLIAEADRPFWVGKFELSAVQAEAELARLSATHPGNDKWYESGRVEGGSQDESLSVDRKPKAERDALLSRATAWALHQGLSASDYHLALAAVMGNDSDEGAFHRAVLTANPNWGREGSDKLQISGRGFAPRLRGTRGIGLHPDFDPGRAAHVFNAMKSGKIDTRVVPEDVQRAALQASGALSQQLNEASNFQPASRFMIPGLGYGIFQGEFGGSAISPEFAGAANEEGSYPISGNEALRVRVGPAGVPEPIARNAKDKPSSQRGYDFKKVTLQGYGNTQWVDRRDQAAGDSILPIGVMAQAAADALAYGQAEKELIQAAFMRDYASHYATGFYKDLSAVSNRTWDDPNSTPIQDWKGARMAVWRATGSFPELGLMGPDLIETLSFHPQILLAAQQAGVSHIDQPRAFAPVEVLLAVFGPLVIPTCRITTAMDGSAADTPWGQDAILAVVSRGKVLAPRAFATVVSAGYPVVRTLSDDQRGLRGSDGADYADMYAMERVGLSSVKTSSAYIFKNACPQLVVKA